MSRAVRLAVATLVLWPVPALADAIDGTWCAPFGPRALQIDGPQFLTPGGASVRGSYNRHDGAYIAPEGEPGAGRTVQVRQVGHDALQVIEPGSDPAIWRRCELGVVPSV